MVSRKVSKQTSIGSQVKSDVKMHCYICNVLIDNSWDIHSKDLQHSLKTVYFNKNFNKVDNSNKIKCNICSKSVDKARLSGHAIHHHLIPWYRPKDEFIIYFKNFITLLNTKYYCYLCNEEFKYWYTVISHVKSTEHSSLIRVHEIHKKDVNLSLRQKVYITCVANSIFPQSLNELVCFACNCRIPGYLNVYEHVSGRRHKDNLSGALSDDFSKLKNEFTVSFANLVNGYYKRSDHHKACKNQTINLKLNNLISKSLNVDEISDETENSNKTISICKTSDTYKVEIIKNQSANLKLSNLTIESLTVPNMSQARNQNILNKTIQDTDDDIPETWEEVISPRYKGKAITKLENKVVSMQGKINNSPTSSSNQVLHLVPKVSPKSISSKKSKSKSPRRRRRKTSRKNNADTAQESLAKQKPVGSYAQLVRQIAQPDSIYKTIIICNICSAQLKSTVLLHVHMTSHFWIRFIQANDQLDQCKDYYSDINKNFNKSGKRVTINVAYKPSTPKHIVPFISNKEHPKIAALVSNKKSIKTKKKIASPLVVGKRKNSGKSVALSPNEKQGWQKDPLDAVDFEIDNRNAKHIYEIDTEQLKVIKFSITRCCLLNENIYCLICRKNVVYSLCNFYEHLRDIDHNYYLLEMLQDHAKFLTFHDQFSDLLLARQTMEDVSNENVYCYACEENIMNNVDNIKEHLIEEKHAKNRALIALADDVIANLYSRIQRNWYNVQGYWCVPCRTRYIQEHRFYEHITKTTKHKKECAKFRQYQNLIFDFCPTCATLFYGFRDTFAHHCSVEKHKFFCDKPFYVVSKVPLGVEKMLKNPESIINNIITSLAANIDDEKVKEMEIVCDLETIVNYFIEANAHRFGSRVNGLATETSDLDIFLDCEDRYYRGHKLDDILHILETVESGLKPCSEIWNINRTVKDCSVPIIKVTHNPTGINCDITFANGLPIELSHLIRNFNEKFPLCRELSLFVKQWLQECNLGGENGICSYAIAWFVIFYLQKKSILPTIIELIKQAKQRGESRFIDIWDVGVIKDFELPQSSNSNYSFKGLLKEFFAMYAEFDYRNDIICPLLGYPVKKELFVNPTQLLPGEMSTYKQYCKRKKHEMLRIDSPMCIQDPFDLSSNITKAVKKFTVYKFKTYCAMTVKKL